MITGFKRFFATIFLIIFVIAAAVIYIYGNYDFLPGQKDNSLLRGVRVTNHFKIIISPTELKRIRNTGFNTVLISPKGYYFNGRVYSVPFTYTLIGIATKRAHAAGLKVALQPELVILSRSELPISERLPLDFLLTWHQRWAKQAEKAGIEYFIISPSAYRSVAREVENDWLLETLKEIKTYYSGKTGFLINHLFCNNGSSSIEMQLFCLEKSLTGRSVHVYLPELKGFDFIVYELYPPAETKNLSLFVVDAARIDRVLRKYALRKGLGEVVYAGINLPLYGVKNSSLYNIPLATKKEQVLYLEKMIQFLNQNKAGFIIYDWDSETFELDRTAVQKQKAGN